MSQRITPPWNPAALLGLGAGPPLQRLARAILAVATAGAAVTVLLDFVVAPLTGHFSGLFQDFGPIYAAGQAANHGTDPYAFFTAHSSTSPVRLLGFDYLPLIAVVARPLAALPYHMAQTIWLWLVLAATITAAIIVARETLPRSWSPNAIGLCVAALFPPAVYNIWNGQMNAMVFLSLAVAFRSWRRGNQVGCGLALGLGGIAKVAPAALLVLLIRRRWWRGLATGVGAVLASLVAAGTFLGFDRVREWFTQVLPVLGRVDGWYFNQSLGALISRLAEHNVFRLDPPNGALQLTVTGLSVCCLVAVASSVKGEDTSQDRRDLEFAMGVVAMIVAGAVAWWSDYGSLALPLLVIVGLTIRGRATTSVVAAGSVALALAGIGGYLFLALGGTGWVPSTHGSSWWWVALQVDSLPAYSALALLLTMLLSLARTQVISRRDRAGSLATA
jgi:hypothetical protein